MTAIVTRMRTARPVEGLIMTIIVRAEIYVADSRLDEFREVATQLAAAAGAEAGPLGGSAGPVPVVPVSRCGVRVASSPLPSAHQGRVLAAAAHGVSAFHVLPRIASDRPFPSRASASGDLGDTDVLPRAQPCQTLAVPQLPLGATTNPTHGGAGVHPDSLRLRRLR